MINQTEKINSNNVFIVKYSDLPLRYDPYMVLYISKSKSYKYKTVPLKNLIKKSPQYGANEEGVKRISQNETRYIRITDINEFGLLNNEIGVTTEKIESKYILNNNDILFARSGSTVGKTYIHKSENVNYHCLFAGYMIRIVVDEEKILPSYLFTYTQLSIYKDWVKAIKRVVGQPNINAEEYKSLLIPLAPFEIQQNVVKIFNDAYLCKIKKEEDAKTLLESIDTYILNELGVLLPEQKNTLKDRIFKVNFSEVVGGRLDPNYHLKYYSKVIKIFKNGKFMYLPLKNFSSFQAGYSFKSTDYLEKSECQLITIKNIQKNEINFEDVTFLPDEFYNNYKNFQIKNNDILIAMTGATIGKVAIYNSSKNSLLNQRVGLIKAININSIYLMSLLNLPIFQQFILRNSNGGAQPNISETDIMKISIPVPSIEKQNEIATQILKIKKEADELIKQANLILEDAKKTVELMIIG